MSGIQHQEHSLVISGVGPRLRAIREVRNKTLADVSAATGISVSTLSRLESGGRKPTLELLFPLSQHYRVPLDELVGAPAVGDPRVHITPIRQPGKTILPLSSGDGQVSVFKYVVHARREPEEPVLRTHPGREWLYVMAGGLRLALGEQEYLLGPGEAAEFDTSVPHWFGAAGPVAAEFLGIFSHAGERAHVRELDGNQLM